MTRALVLAAHGSRRDPAANALVRRLAEAVRSRRLFDEVAVAFHQGEPRFDSVLDEITADEVTVVPLLTSAGHYTDVVLPECLARNHRFPGLRLRQTPPVGTHSGIAPLVARRVAEVLRSNEIPRHSASLAIVGHGTPRHPESRGSALQLAETLRRRRVAGEVLAAFIDDDPPLQALLDTATLPHVVVVPFLIGGGTHASEDIPRLLGLADWRLATANRRRRVIVDQPIGTYPGLVEIIIDLARRHAPPPAPRFRPRPVRSRREPGTVHLVGAGPGDPGLITARGLDLLRGADVVIHDRLIGSELLGEARNDALLIDVGKGPGHAPYSQTEINALLVEHAGLAHTVVRLKGGDPFVFGRGSEEAAACTRAGVRVEVVPGLSSAIAGPAAAGIPVTARGVAQSFAVVTAQQADGPADLSGFAEVDTLVVLMGLARLGQIADQLIAAGRDPATPAACIQSASTEDQRVTRASLATIAAAADRDGLQSPVVIVIGEVAGLDVGGTAGQRVSGSDLTAAIGA
ncbi:MAG: uroporphyrin-III C-methyltransferase [Gemmatimonadales bacterium]|nr:uroporphyrin-III C-methyltransferase [Gemmatimonadales bacterium]